MLHIVPHNVPRFGRSYEHFPDGFELHLLPQEGKVAEAEREREAQRAAAPTRDKEKEAFFEHLLLKTLNFRLFPCRLKPRLQVS
jgi:hypothetical protein